MKLITVLFLVCLLCVSGGLANADTYSKASDTDLLITYAQPPAPTATISLDELDRQIAEHEAILVDLNALRDEAINAGCKTKVELEK